MDDELERVADEPPAAEESAGRPWWRRGWFVLLLGMAAPLVGLVFLALIGVVLLLSDTARGTWLRLGGTVGIVGWTWLWTLTGIPPVPAAVLFGVTAVLLALAAAGARRRPVELALTAALATLALVLSVMALVPYGLRTPTIDRDRAITLTVSAWRFTPSNQQIHATQASADPARHRLTQRPYYLVLLYEPHPTTATTGDGEPCFGRAQAFRVERIDGTVERGDIVNGREEDGGCLPVKVGTKSHLRPLPTPAS